MRKQTAPKGTILNLIPKFLIIPAALEGIAVQITNPINLAATASSADVPAFVRAMVPIVEPRLDAVASVGDTNWYTAADPSSIDTIEYCYLEGAQRCLHRDPAGLRGGRRRDQGSSGLCGGGDRLPRLAEEHCGVGRLSQHSEATKRRKES